MSKLDKGYAESFIKEIGRELTIKAACSKCNVSRQSIYRCLIPYNRYNSNGNSLMGAVTGTSSNRKPFF